MKSGDWKFGDGGDLKIWKWEGMDNIFDLFCDFYSEILNDDRYTPGDEFPGFLIL